MTIGKCGWTFLVVLVVVPGVSGAAMLPPVHMSAGCGYVHPSDLAGTFDAQGGGLLTLLQAAGVTGLPVDWPSADLETVGGQRVGDGIPDYYELALLGSVLCTGNAAIQSQFDENVTAFQGFIGYLATQVGSAAAAAPESEMTTVAAAIAAWAAGLTDPGYEMLQLQAIITADALSQAAPLLPVLESTLDGLTGFKEWLAAMAGLSTEMSTTFSAFLDPLTTLVPTYMDTFATLAVGVNVLILSTPVPPLTPELLAQCTALVEDLTDAATVLQNIQIDVPDFAIYHAVKTAGEPFSGYGDYDGDGSTNKVVYDGVRGTGGGRPEFVAAASGYNPFWPGNPGLPVAGALGLMVLGGVCVFAGARALRKQ